MTSRIPNPELSALVVANVIPVVGIILFDLSVLGLLTLYWLELGIVSFWAVVRATFAGRPLERDGDPVLLGALNQKQTSIPVPLIAANIRLMTIPTLLFVTPILITLWLLVGGLLVGAVVSVNPDADPSSWLALGAFGIFIAEGWRTATRYFQTGAYQNENVATALRSVLTEGATVLIASVVALLAAALVVTNGGGGEDPRAVERLATGPLILVVVLIRLLTDLAGYYYDGRLSTGLWSLIGRDNAYSPPERDSIDTTVSGTVTQLRPSLPGRLLPTASHLRAHPGPWLLSPLAFLAAAVAVSQGAVQAVGGLILIGIGVPLGLIHVDYWIRYAGVQYRKGPNTVVATDTVFKTPLWRIESLDSYEVRVEQDGVDKLLDTSTVIINVGPRPTTIPRLKHSNPILRSIDDSNQSNIDARDKWDAETTDSDSFIGVGTALLRLDDSSSTQMSLVSIGLFGAVSLIGLVISAQFQGGVAAGVFVFLFATIPFVLLVIYALQQ